MIMIIFLSLYIINMDKIRKYETVKRKKNITNMNFAKWLVSKIILFDTTSTVIIQ